MKFYCFNSTIKEEIEYAMGCSAQKSSMSISSTVLLECMDDNLMVRSTDGKMSFASKVNVTTAEPGSCAVFCDKLLAILKNMPEGNLEFAESEGKLTIRPVEGGSKIKVNIKTMDATRFPALDVCKDDEWFTLPQKDFCDLADRTMLCVSDDQTRLFLTGVRLDSEDNELEMAATDGRRMGYSHTTVEQGLPQFPPTTLPVKFLQLVKSICTGEGTFSLAIVDGEVFAKVGERLVKSSAIGGSYPNFRKVIPSSFAHVCSVNADELAKAISLVSVMIENKSRRIFLDINPEGILVSGENNEYGDSKQGIPCDYEGPEMKFAFNSALLLPVVKKVDTKDVEVCLNSDKSAIGIRPKDGRFIYVLMPMSL